MIGFYCAKCKGLNVSAVCAMCGKTLSANTMRVTLEYERVPALDVQAWRAAALLAAAAALTAGLMIFALEMALGGALMTALTLAASDMAFCAGGALILFALALMLQGRESNRVILESEGAHRQVWVLKPSALHRLARMQRGISMYAPNPETPPIELMEETHLPWRKVAFVRMRPSRSQITLYAPRLIPRITLHMLPEEYGETEAYVLARVKNRKTPVKGAQA